MDELTIEKLKAMEPYTVFAKGITMDDERGVNICNTGKMIKWVAKRGQIHDWAIYTDNPHDPQRDFQSVVDCGDKIIGKENIKKLVPCSKEAFDMYRY